MDRALLERLSQEMRDLERKQDRLHHEEDTVMKDNADDNLDVVRMQIKAQENEKKRATKKI